MEPVQDLSIFENGGISSESTSDKKSYIVMLDQDPIITFEGHDDSGYEATKPGKGGKVNPNR